MEGLHDLLPLEKRSRQHQEFIRDRYAYVARSACAQYPGALVEIGAYEGKTTIRLLEIAQRYDREMIVVDPWTPGVQQCGKMTYEAFARRTAPWIDRMTVIQKKSQDPGVIVTLGDGDIAFALVDGLHTYDACRTDIESVSHAGIIAVDDLWTFPNVRRAFVNAAWDLHRDVYMPAHCREGYIE
jgi:hypothetical protein